MITRKTRYREMAEAMRDATAKADEAKATAQTAAADMEAYMDALLGTDEEVEG